MVNRYITYTVLVCLYCHPLSALSAPFDDCPTEAFLIQTPSTKPITYGVDLSTGSYSTLSPDMGTSKVNGVGFNFHDNYMYGWDYSAGTLAKFGNDFITQPLNVTSGLIGQQFFVGDVSLAENKWFGYRSSYGLYSIDLTNPDQALTMINIASASSMGNPRITDFAFHPTNGLIYVVDNNGFMHTIDPATGETSLIREVLNEPSAGFNFTFGAQYFDVNNNLYISNNGNGYIYKIDTDATQPSAIFFAYGPTSQSNDGARCALAPVISTTGLDFGDAPQSYQTSFDASGPRHGESTLFLGNLLDTESDAYIYPLSDDTSDNSDDDDGISFVTGIELGETAIIQAYASQSGGFLSAWIDWNQNGTFDANEQIFSDEALNAGTNNLSLTVPTWAKSGSTWSRFRISSLSGIGPTGGVSDGEVEDYSVSVTASNVSVSYYPSSNSYTSIAYEDLWPIEGDYDMNDLLMNMRIAEYSIGGDVIRIEIEGKIAAIGAGFSNGFAVQLPSIPPSAIQSSAIELTINGQTVESPGVEENQNYAVLIVTQNTWSMTNSGEGLCEYFRTQTGCGTALRPSWKLVIPLATPILDSLIPEPPYDPFIFATANTHHSSLVSSVVGTLPGRAWEVHLKNNAPSNALNTNLLNIADDASSVAQQHYYQTSNGMPWALEVPEDWKHPTENTDLSEAYPQFKAFAESSGSLQTDWYLESKAVSDLIFQD
jgi:LruC domain-containing protein